MERRWNPAVVAGLGGAMVWAVPSTALALSVRQVVDIVRESPELAFAAGFAGGALAVGGVVGVCALVRSHRRRREGLSLPQIGSEGSLEDTGTAVDTPVTYVPRHMRAVEPELEEASEVGSPAKAPGHAARDYEQIAENYVRRASFRERMANRAQGVAATLRDRMGSGRMSGVPVIARADGSVGDVGTSWWKASVGEDAIISDSGFAVEEELAIPSDFTGSVSLTGGFASSSGNIATRVARVDEEAYPERRTVDDIVTEDEEWNAALRSLDEKIMAEAPARPEPIGFVDVVGGADTLDEPDNLELDTSFIPFKTPAGHPEVVDTETYVDYLIDDEFSKNSSPVARRSSRRFLTVLEGGTSPARRLSDTSASRAVHVPKHFASAQAAEA